MTYNPRLINLDNNIINVSGSIVVNKPGTVATAFSLTSSQITASNLIITSLQVDTVDTLLAGFKTNIQTINSDTTLTNTQHIILADASNQTINISLPVISTAPFQEYNIKKIDGTSNNINIVGQSSSFEPSTANYRQLSILTGSLATGSNEQFGYSVALNSAGDVALIGAPYDETGSRDDPDAMGVAYIFRSASSGWVQEKFLTGSLATGSTDQFGTSVALNSVGNIALIGAPNDETGSRGDPNAMGIAYIFKSASSGWVQEKFLTGSLATGSSDFFGWSVALNSVGNIALIGAPYDETGSAGVPDAMGVAYVFRSASSGWVQEKFLTGSLATGSTDQFGYSVALNSVGNIALIGAINDETGSRGDPDGMGVAYVFRSASSGWVQEKFLTGSLAKQASDYFGRSVAINSIGNIIGVGANLDETGSNVDTGLVYIFRSASSGWSQEAILSGSLANQTDDRFGVSITFNSSGNIAIIGARYDEFSNNNLSGGLAYVFVSGNNGWSEKHVLFSRNAQGIDDSFGFAVSTNATGNLIFIGAPLDEPGNETGSLNNGVVYTYELTNQNLIDRELSVSIGFKNDSLTLINDGTGSWYII